MIIWNEYKLVYHSIISISHKSTSFLQVSWSTSRCIQVDWGYMPTSPCQYYIEYDRHDHGFLGRLLVCQSPAFLHVRSASEGWKISLKSNLKNRPWWHSKHPGFLQYLWRAQVADQGASGGRWSDQTIRTISNPLLPLITDVQNMVGRVPFIP